MQDFPLWAEPNGGQEPFWLTTIALGMVGAAASSIYILRGSRNLQRSDLMGRDGQGLHGRSRAAAKIQVITSW